MGVCLWPPSLHGTNVLSVCFCPLHFMVLMSCGCVFGPNVVVVFDDIASVVCYQLSLVNCSSLHGTNVFVGVSLAPFTSWY